MSAHRPDSMVPRGRLALLALAGACLFGGAWAGLARLGIPLPSPSPEAIAGHGALMVGGMLGTLISLERAVALERRWAFAAPLASGLAGVAALCGASWSFVTGTFVVASLLFVLENVLFVVRQRALFTLVMLLGALLWAAGNLAWALDVAVDRVVIAWAAFLVLTIAGERLELSRMAAPPPRAAGVFGVLSLGLVAGAILSLFEPLAGGRIAGGSLIFLCGWLVRYDLARRTLRRSGLPRYAAISVLGGYVWLALGGALFAVHAPLASGPLYDAALHAVFLGFVFSMVFGHAPIILPAVLRTELPYAPLLYAPLGLLHASVAVRIAGDLLALPTLRQVGGVLNVVTLGAFAASVVFVKLRARAAAQSEHSHGRGLRALAVLALAFGAATVVAGGRTLFDPSVRAAAEPVVPFVLVFNFAAGFAYLAAALGLWSGRRWAAWLAVLIAASTLLVFSALGAHIAAGEPFSPRTVLAMALRSALWCAITAASWRALIAVRPAATER